MKVYVTGNILVEMDSLPLKLIPLLETEIPGAEFIEFDPTEDFVPEDKKMIIVDTVANASDIVLIDDIEKIELEKNYSLHDFDLGYNLKLMKKFNMIDSVKIIGIPPGYPVKDAVKKIKAMLSSLRPL